jgi:methionyl-tRNA formyltransferase
MRGLPSPHGLHELCDGLERSAVADHNDPRVVELLRAAQVEWVLLGGTRILRGALLELDMLNVHPGLLPWVRGSTAEAWAILKDYPVGVTCHRVDSGVDTGPILLRRRLALEPGWSYEHIVWGNVRLAATTMVDALRLVRAGATRFVSQDLEAGRGHRVMGPRKLAEVRRKLADGTYHPRALPL